MSFRDYLRQQQQLIDCELTALFQPGDPSRPSIGHALQPVRRREAHSSMLCLAAADTVSRPSIRRHSRQHAGVHHTIR
jgi:hypothetical protein